MTKLSLLIGAAGIALLLWSFVPNGSTQQAPLAVTTSTMVAADAATGRALFGAKGCGACHVNQRAPDTQGECCGGVGPELTNYSNDPAFLRRWLADPEAVRPGTRMPDLHLSSEDIENLIAFLNEPR